MPAEAGTLVLVVGPSGAGKDTLIAAARARLEANTRFVFPRRIVTRAAVAELEDHASLDRAEFEALRREGAFALDWQAHGLSYALPRSILADLALGRVVVANSSRGMIAEAARLFPKCRVFLVTADNRVRAQRLAGRGRETAAEIEGRLSREGAPVPEGVEPVVIDNSGALEDGVAAFVDALRQTAATTT